MNERDFKVGNATQSSDFTGSVFKKMSFFEAADLVNLFFAAIWQCRYLTENSVPPFTTFWSDSQKAFLRKRKCCLPLKSKSNQWVNSSILKSFEPKFSIFAMHQYPSFSPNLNIILKKCWYLCFWICLNLDFFSTLIFDQIWIFKNVWQN